MARQYLSKHDGPLADDKPDTGAAAKQKVTRIPASAVQVEKPAGAASSVFDIVKPEPKTARKPYTPRDPNTPRLSDLVVIKDRPIPPAETGAKASGDTYGQTYERMGPGGSVDVCKRQMFAFRSWAKRQGKRLIVRRFSADKYGIWRPTAEQEQQHAED